MSAVGKSSKDPLKGLPKDLAREIREYQNWQNYHLP
jgi:hypothetical protein